MKPAANPAQILHFITQPAFLVKDGIIAQVNNAALNYQISVGMPIMEMITCGKDDYETFSSGKLYLALRAGRAWVSACDGFHLFCFEDSITSPELRAFALASQNLRIPLSDAVLSAEAILQREDLEDAELKKQIGQINRSLYRVMRTVCNMSDASQLGYSCNMDAKPCNAKYVFSEMFEKAANFIESSGRSLQFRNLKQDIDCILDQKLIERAVLNMISNAVKFSPADSTIQAVLKCNKNRLSLTIENSIQEDNPSINSSTYSRFLREPGLESANTGIGLGMSIISCAASSHNGTILLTLTRKGVIKVTISIPIHTTIEPAAKSPIILLDGYTGGMDTYLVELSDILPNHFYENI